MKSPTKWDNENKITQWLKSWALQRNDGRKHHPLQRNLSFRTKTHLPCFYNSAISQEGDFEAIDAKAPSRREFRSRNSRRARLIFLVGSSVSYVRNGQHVYGVSARKENRLGLNKAPIKSVSSPVNWKRYYACYVCGRRSWEKACQRGRKREREVAAFVKGNYRQLCRCDAFTNVGRRRPLLRGARPRRRPPRANCHVARTTAYPFSHLGPNTVATVEKSPDAILCRVLCSLPVKSREIGGEIFGKVIVIALLRYPNIFATVSLTWNISFILFLRWHWWIKVPMHMGSSVRRN